MGANKDVIAKKKKQISDIISGDARLRSKKELIEQFIEDNLIHLGEEDNVDEAFETYWDEQKKKAFKTICTDEGVEEEKLQKIIENYLFSHQDIERDDVVGALKVKPKVLERKKISVRIIDKVIGFVETFIYGMAA